MSSTGLSPRLQKLKLAQVEVETKHRERTAEEPARLEAILKVETDKFLTLNETMENCKKNKASSKLSLLRVNREHEFLQDKINKIDTDNLELRLKELTTKIVHKVKSNREELDRLSKALEEFADLEPTNEALKLKIDDMKKSRESLEITFLDGPL